MILSSVLPTQCINEVDYLVLLVYRFEFFDNPLYDLEEFDTNILAYSLTTTCDTVKIVS